MKKIKSYYDVLKVSPRAGDEEIKRAYKIMALKFHPDRNPRNRPAAEEYFCQISEAYTALKTRERRAAYNQKLRKTIQPDNDNEQGLFDKIGAFFHGSKPNKKEELQR